MWASLKGGSCWEGTSYSQVCWGQKVKNNRTATLHPTVGKFKISLRPGMLFPGIPSKAELFPVAGSCRGWQWVKSLLSDIQGSSLPALPLSAAALVSVSLRWPRECGRGVWTALPLQDAWLLQPGGTSASALPAGGLLPGHQGAGEYRTEQEGNELFPGLSAPVRANTREVKEDPLP